MLRRYGSDFLIEIKGCRRRPIVAGSIAAKKPLRGDRVGTL
jgi:hypothetical protein